MRLLGITIGEPDEFPREITRTNPISSESVGENGWLIRFFDSAFFCEWIAVSYLYKHEHSGVRDYLCNRMYTLPLSGIEGYLFQICYMMVHKPSPSLDKFVIDVCSKSLKIALKVHWFLMAEIEDCDDNDGISRIQEKCQIAATLMGDWPPLIRPLNEGVGSGGKNQMLNKLLSSKQRLLSLTSSPPMQRSFTFSPSSGSNVGDENGKMSPDENNKLFKKFMPGPKVRDALLFRKSAEKEDDDSEKDGFFRRLLRDSKDEDEELTASSEGFFKRLFRDSKSDSEERSVSRSIDDDEKENFFRKMIKEVFDDKKDANERNNEEEKDGIRKSVEDDEKEGFFKKLFKDKFEDKKDGNEGIEDEHKNCSNSVKDDDKEGFFRKLFKDKSEDKKDISERKDDEDDEKEGFFRKFFKEKFEEKTIIIESLNPAEDKIHANGDEEEPSDFPLFRKLFRVHPEEAKATALEANGFEGSPGTENFFRKLFRDRDRSVEDSELFGIKKIKEKNLGSVGSPSQQNQKTNLKPPLPNSAISQFRKGAYHESLDFVHALCETSFGLVDVFPVEDRKCALRESLAEINSHVAESQTSGGVCFPIGKGVYRVLNIPEDEAVLLNSREKAPYLICVEVVKCETPSYVKDTSNAQKLSKGGIPLAYGDALLPKPPPWAYPLGTVQEAYNNDDRMSKSTSQVIDRAMGQFKEAKVKFVSVSLSVEEQCCDQPFHGQSNLLRVGRHTDLEYVRVVLTTDPRLRLEDIEDQEPPRRKEHRRVPSILAMEEVKAAAAKGEAPLGLPLKGAGQDSDAQSKVANGGPPKPTDALSGELWEVKRDRIQKASVHGKLPGWDLRSFLIL